MLGRDLVVGSSQDAAVLATIGIVMTVKVALGSLLNVFAGPFSAHIQVRDRHLLAEIVTTRLTVALEQLIGS